MLLHVHCCLQQVLSQEHAHVAQELSSLQARQANLAPLMRLILPSLAQDLPHNPGLEPLATALLRQVALDTQLVQAAAVQLLKAGADAASTGNLQHLQQVLRVCDLHYPDQLDAAINTALQEAAAAAPAAADHSSSKGKKQKGSKKQQQGSNAADALFEFVQQCFAGSRHEVLTAAAASIDGDAHDHNQQQQQALTLSLAVNAPAREVRIMALQKLDAVCSSSTTVPESTKQLLQSSLLSGLRDDVLAVAAAAAAAQGLASIPGEQLLPALQYLLQRAAVVIAAGHIAADPAAADSGAGGAKEALRAAQAALAAVAAVGQRAEAASPAQGALQQQAAALLLEYALGDKRRKKLSKAAVKVALECSWSPLLQALASSPAVAAALEGSPADESAAAADAAAAPGSKRRKKGSQTAAAAADDGAEQAAAGKHSGVLAVNRAVVSALADAVLADSAESDAAGGGLLQQVAALVPVARPRCQQLLLLVLANAAAAAAASAPPVKAASKAGKQAKAASKTAAGDAGGSPVSAAIAAVLIKALEERLSAAAGADDSKKATITAELPSRWSDECAELLDAAQLPTKQHLQELPTQLQHLNAVVLLAGLHTALSAAPAAALVQELGQPVQLFARLAAASADSSGRSSGLLQHLQLIVEKSGTSPEQQLQFLSSIYGLPTAVAGESVQVVALQLLPQAAADCTASSSSSPAWFVRLLAAANSSSKPVRKAAVAALLSLLSSSSSVLAQAIPEDHLQELLKAFQEQQQLLKGSAGALQGLLCSAAAAAGGEAAMDVDAAHAEGSSRPRRGSKTGSGKSKAAHQATPDSPAATGALQMNPEAFAAFRQLLCAALPGLSEESDLLGAQCAVAVLAAGAEASAADAAQQLLQQLLIRLCKHNAAAVSGLSKGPVWRQLVLVGQGAAAVPDAASQLHQLRTDIAASMLQFFIPAVLQQNSAVADTFVHLLKAPFSPAAAAAVLGCTPAADTSSSGGSTVQLTPVQLAAVAPVRVAALEQFTPQVFDALPHQQQQAAFTAALQTLASDGSAACRAAARLCLEQLPVTANMLLVLLLSAVGSEAQQPTPHAPPATPSRAKRARKTSSSSQQQQEEAAGLQAQASGVLSQDGSAAAGQVSAPALDAAIAALEFMQWRDDVPNRQVLQQPLQQLLQLLVPLMGSIAESHQEEEEEADGADVLAAAAASADATTAQPAGGVSASAAGYAAQLVLLVLEQLVKEQIAAGTAGTAGAAGAAGSSIDVNLVLSCASAAPDGAVRNAALLLMAALGQLSPGDVLEHVLKVCEEDNHSFIQLPALPAPECACAFALLVFATTLLGLRLTVLTSAILTMLLRQRTKSWTQWVVPLGWLQEGIELEP